MNIVAIQNVWFDDAMTLAMGEGFDGACNLLRYFGSAGIVREIIAKRIIGSANNGERDPARLREPTKRLMIIRLLAEEYIK